MMTMMIVLRTMMIMFLTSMNSSCVICPSWFSSISWKALEYDVNDEVCDLVCMISLGWTKEGSVHPKKSSYELKGGFGNGPVSFESRFIRPYL